MLTSNLPEYLEHPSFIDAGVIALLGYGTVFVGLVALMIVLVLLGKAFSAKKNAPQEEAAPAPMASVAPAPVSEPVMDAAPGTAGQLKLYDTPPKTAAMLMAIVAEKMGKPLNELRFISIKEVK